MRKTTMFKPLLRSPLKTILTFLLITAASFAVFSQVTDYAVTTRESQNARSLYHAVAALDNVVFDIPVQTVTIFGENGCVFDYGMMYEMKDKPWPAKEEMREFMSLPGVTLAETGYITAGLVEDFKRIKEYNVYDQFVFEGTYAGYNNSDAPDHIQLKFDDVRVVACEEDPKIGTSVVMEDFPFGDMWYAESPYTRSFFENIKEGSRCLVVAYKTNEGYAGSGVYLPYYNYEDNDQLIRVLDGSVEECLKKESYAQQKGFVDAIHQNIYAYDIVYTSDMRALFSFNEQSLSVVQGRSLMAEDTDACVVSDIFLKEHNLSVGDTIHVKLGDRNSRGRVFEGTDVSEFGEPKEFAIIGAYAGAKGEDAYSYPANTIYVSSALIPEEISEDDKLTAEDLNVFVENARDIEAFHTAAEQFAEKVGLTLVYSDRGWLDVKDSLGMGALASLLTTVLYVIGAMAALFLAVYLYIGRNKKTYATMRMLGVSGKAAGAAAALPFVAVSVFAIPVGGIAGLYYAQNIAAEALAQMADSAPIGYIPNATLPAGIVILCLFLELLYISLAAYVFLRNMKETPPLELLHEGAARLKNGAKAEPVTVSAAPAPANLDLSKISALQEWERQKKYGAVRHVASYIRRHMRRSIGKTAVSLGMAVVLAAGVGVLVLAGGIYENAFYSLGVKGRASDFTYTSVKTISKTPLVKDFYCYGTFGMRVRGSEDNIIMTVTNDLTRNLGNRCTVEYARGYDMSFFDGTAQVCLVGEQLAKEQGISPGDEIGMMSGVLYSILTVGGEDAVENGYKTYKVAGVVKTDDENIRNSILAGMRSDLERLFSMDFSIEHCEFTLADNDRLDELDATLMNHKERAFIVSPLADYHLDSGGLTDIQRIRSLLEALFPIAVAAAVVIGMTGSFLIILQSAQEAAVLRVLGTTKKRVRCILVLEQAVFCTIGIVLAAGGVALAKPGVFAESASRLGTCFGLYFMGCICSAALAAVLVTRHKALELLQVKE